jgi:hypothetical protein
VHWPPERMREWLEGGMFLGGEREGGRLTFLMRDATASRSVTERWQPRPWGGAGGCVSGSPAWEREER